MKKIILITALLTTPLFSQTADEIIEAAEDLIKGETAYGKTIMTVVTPDYTRELEMESWWVGNEKALIVIKSPRKEAGNKTLKIGNEMWSYLRNTETTIKVPPSMMLQSWNGSDFTNDDLVRESKLSRDYFTKIIEEEEINGTNCWKIELEPKPDAPVVWGKLLYWVTKDKRMPAKVEFYDEKGKLIRYMEYSKVKTFGDRTLPSLWTMHNEIKKGRSTSFELIEMEFNIDISERIFSFQELERGN